MLLCLREIIDVPGNKISFDYEPDLATVPSGSIIRINELPKARGNVSNSAGVLKLTANVDAVCLCACARCLKEFQMPLNLDISVFLTENIEDEEASDYYIIKNEQIDLDKIITSEILLNLDERLLCRDDCRGLCHKCGIDLNESSCSCKKEVDPRLAKLAQLL